MTGSNTMTIGFPGGLRVDADYQGHHLATDQPTDEGGDGSAPEPFVLFLASIGTCAGFYVLKFCQARDLPLDGVALKQRTVRDPETKRLVKVELEVEVPPGFPARYHGALVRAASQCAVKKAIEAPIAIETRIRVL